MWMTDDDDIIQNVVIENHLIIYMLLFCDICYVQEEMLTHHLFENIV
jgi:hypothetical protein